MPSAASTHCSPDLEMADDERLRTSAFPCALSKQVKPATTEGWSRLVLPSAAVGTPQTKGQPRALSVPRVACAAGTPCFEHDADNSEVTLPV